MSGIPRVVESAAFVIERHAKLTEQPAHAFASRLRRDQSGYVRRTAPRFDIARKNAHDGADVIGDCLRLGHAIHAEHGLADFGSGRHHAASCASP
jgi:hypothetical protein